MRVRLIVSYEGTSYSGYQIQNNAKTIQQCIEEAIEKIYGTKIKTMAASRTDAGVHALCQNVVFDIEKSSIPIDKLYIVLNKNLPKDIKIIKSMQVNENFNPRYDTVKKTYSYTIFNGDDMPPFYRNFMTEVKKQLDIKSFVEASKYFIGTYDFIGFSSTGSSVKNTVRTIYDFKVDINDNIIKCTITGDGFLYNMIRIIIGTLIEVGHNKINCSEIKDIILSKDRTRAGKTAKPNGLVLEKIYYDIDKKSLTKY